MRKRPEGLSALIADLRSAVEGEYVIPNGLDLLKPLPPKVPNPPSGRYWIDRIKTIVKEERH
jgi:hypothetical protein